MNTSKTNEATSVKVRLNKNDTWRIHLETEQELKDCYYFNEEDIAECCIEVSQELIENYNRAEEEFKKLQDVLWAMYEKKNKY